MKQLEAIQAKRQNQRIKSQVQIETISVKPKPLQSSQTRIIPQPSSLLCDEPAQQKGLSQVPHSNYQDQGYFGASFPNHISQTAAFGCTAPSGQSLYSKSKQQQQQFQIGPSTQQAVRQILQEQPQNVKNLKQHAQQNLVSLWTASSSQHHSQQQQSLTQVMTTKPIPSLSTSQLSSSHQPQVRRAPSGQYSHLQQQQNFQIQQNQWQRQHQQVSALLASVQDQQNRQQKQIKREQQSKLGSRNEELEDNSDNSRKQRRQHHRYQSEVTGISKNLTSNGVLGGGYQMMGEIMNKENDINAGSWSRHRDNKIQNELENSQKCKKKFEGGFSNLENTEKLKELKPIVNDPQQQHLDSNKLKKGDEILNKKQEVNEQNQVTDQPYEDKQHPRYKIQTNQLNQLSLAASSHLSQNVQPNNNLKSHSISLHQNGAIDPQISSSSRSKNKEENENIQPSSENIQQQQSHIDQNQVPKSIFFDGRRKSQGVTSNFQSQQQQQHKSTPLICPQQPLAQVTNQVACGISNDKDKQSHLRRESNESNSKKNKSPTPAWQKMNALMSGIGNNNVKCPTSNVNLNQNNKINTGNSSNSNNNIMNNSNHNSNNSNNVLNNINNSQKVQIEINNNNSNSNNSSSANSVKRAENNNDNNKKQQQDGLLNGSSSSSSLSKKNANLTFAQHLKNQKQEIEVMNHSNLLASSLLPPEDNRKYFTLQYASSSQQQQSSSQQQQQQQQQSIVNSSNNNVIAVHPPISVNQNISMNPVSLMMHERSDAAIINSNAYAGIINPEKTTSYIQEKNVSKSSNQQKIIQGNISKQQVASREYSKENITSSNKCQQQTTRNNQDDENKIKMQCNQPLKQNLNAEEIKKANNSNNINSKEETAPFPRNRRNGILGEKSPIDLLHQNQPILKEENVQERIKINEAKEDLINDNKSPPLSQLNQIENGIYKKLMREGDNPFLIVETFNEEDEIGVPHFESCKDLMTYEKIKEKMVRMNQEENTEKQKEKQKEGESDLNNQIITEADFVDLLCEEDDLQPNTEFDQPTQSVSVAGDPNNAFCQQTQGKAGTLNIENLAQGVPHFQSFSNDKDSKQLPTVQNQLPQVAPFDALSPLKALENLQKELAEFSKKEEEDGNQKIFGSENLEYLVSRETDYAPDPSYLSKSKQMNLTSNMRAILLDWMMEVAEEFGLKRETYHMAVSLVDRYLSVQLHIKKRLFQLIGVTALYMSSKLEEIYPPRIGDFVCSTNSGYTPEEINQTELSILQSLKFLINPPTSNMWGNWFMSQWDIYVATSRDVQNNSLVIEHNSKQGYLYQFKQPSESSYLLFREFSQLVDTYILDINTLQFHPRHILASFMYLVLAKAFGLLESKTIIEQVGEGILSFDRDQEFNNLFNPFLSLSFGLTLGEILPAMYYVAIFFSVSLNTDIPSGAKQDQLFQVTYQ